MQNAACNNKYNKEYGGIVFSLPVKGKCMIDQNSQKENVKFLKMHQDVKRQISKDKSSGARWM
jgi:hypothetical protein